MNIQSPSKYKIIRGMIELIGKKRLSAVKVADILTAANVSHQTFYRIFSDKFDACECACYELLSNATAIVGNNATVKEHTICTLNIVKTNGAFFQNLLSEPDGIEIIKRTMTRLSEDTIDFRSESPITNAWVFCLDEWRKSHFSTSMDDVYHRIISCYPIGEVMFGDELIAQLERYGRYTMAQLNQTVNSRTGKATP